MSIVPPCYRDENVPEYTRSGASVPVAAGNKVILSTDGVSNGSIQFNKDVDGLLFASLGKQDITADSNPTANVVSLTNDLTGFEPLCVSKLFLAGNATVGTEDAAIIAGDQTNGIALSADISVPSMTVNGTFNGVPPGSCFRATFTGTQSVPNGTFSTGTYITWDTVDFDFVGTTTAPFEDFVIPLNGYYRLYASASYAANGTGVRSVGFRNTTTNTTLDLLSVGGNAVNSVGVSCEGTYLFNANDTVQVWIAQTSGGALNMTSARFEIQMVRAA